VLWFKTRSLTFQSLADYLELESQSPEKTGQIYFSIVNLSK
jgi:hypothetical protein